MTPWCVPRRTFVVAHRCWMRTEHTELSSEYTRWIECTLNARRIAAKVNWWLTSKRLILSVFIIRLFIVWQERITMCSSRAWWVTHIGTIGRCVWTSDSNFFFLWLLRIEKLLISYEKVMSRFSGGTLQKVQLIAEDLLARGFARVSRCKKFALLMASNRSECYSSTFAFQKKINNKIGCFSKIVCLLIFLEQTGRWSKVRTRCAFATCWVPSNIHHSRQNPIIFKSRIP